MNALLNKLFGLSSLGFGDEAVQFGFARPLPPWGWALAVLAAAGIAVWSYWRLTGSLASRMILAGLRGLLLVLLVMLICGPQLVKPNERVEKDWVLVLLDRSASMEIADAPVPGGARRTRDEQLREAVQAHWPALSTLAQDRTVVWLGFDSGAYDLRLAERDGVATGVETGPPAGRRTSIGAALDQALARAAARPVSGIVIISDGRSTDEPTHAAIKRLQGEQIPVFTLALGSPDPVADLAVSKAEAPAMAFLNDTVPVTVEIDRLGSVAPGQKLPGGTIQLIEKTTGLKLDEKPLPEDPNDWIDGRARVTLTNRPDHAGKSEWVVKLVPDTPDLIEQNNQTELAIELVDRPIRVVHFDGYPRWEFRYIKNLLLRERSIRSASLLLASNRQYLQEGELVLDGLPRSPEEWAKFDVVIMGDLPGSMFSREQLEQLKEHIAVRGAGLLWIAGPGSTPGAWRDTPLADLLPFAMNSGSSPSDQPVRAWDEPVVMFPAPAALRLSLLELGETPTEGWPAKLSDPATGWSQLQYAQRIDPDAVKPTAEVLATLAPVSSVTSTNPEGARATPAVLSMRYGAGRVLYVATDEIWRWRYARGEALPERFWLPLIRLQGRESLARGARPAVLEVGPRRPEVEQPVRVAVVLLDQALVDGAPSALTVRVRRAEDPVGTGATMDLNLAQEQGTSQTKGTSRSFATTWLPGEPGRYRLEVVDPMLASLSLVADAEVTLPDDELRHPETDHALLARLSKQSTGQVLTAARLTELPGLLPNREVHISGTPETETLWDKPAVLVLLLLLLTLEWIGRRLIKLA